jgi:hypothetical protein
MDDIRAAEVFSLLHTILCEVQTVKKTVDKHEAKFDDVILQLTLLRQSRAETSLNSSHGCVSICLFNCPRGRACKVMQCSAVKCTIRI